ncbi:cyclophilin-like fold protein [Paraliobacillus sediminis]|uniref:cyclophilin-like fold protein n=1 Tax=Paraliobacillus sediminis TaxID=1885916 RepID=UPI0019679E59|nr:cyclophilin-like fold protein [Paraliobacillus sediminis]
MKKILFILCLFIISFVLSACATSDINESEEINVGEMPNSETNQESEESNVEVEPNSETNNERVEVDMTPESTIALNLTIGDEVFLARLYDNPTAQALIEKLPLSIDMEDLHRNEKFYYFSDKLPTDSKRLGNINVGDIMLYGDNCLVFFYESISSSHSYTRLGYIEDEERFAQAVGDGDIRVSFDLIED